MHLREELRTHLVIAQLLEVLEFSLLFNRPHHREAVAVLEEMFDHTADAVLGLNLV